jgi:chemotaxis protein MotB
MAQRIRHRRKVVADVNNHDRWMVSYADFITLLFAFFVVMYSISSVNEGKYKSLTHSLGTAFSKGDKQESVFAPVQVEPFFSPFQPALLDSLAVPFKAISLDNRPAAELGKAWELGEGSVDGKKQFDPAQIEPSFAAAQATPLDDPPAAFKPGQPDNQVVAETGKTPPDPAQVEPPSDAVQSTLLDMLAVPFKGVTLDSKTTEEVEKKRELSEEILKERRQLNQASDQLEEALAPFIDDNLVAVKRNDYWVELEMNSEMLFLSGEAALSQKAQPALQKIAEVISAMPNVINVEGHTDDIPIDTLAFPSNWDLSSARATSVVQELVTAGISPTRLSAIGYGEFHPIGDNKTEEGRFKNRRVTLVLMSQAFARYGANDEERAKLLNLLPTANAGHSSTGKH